MDTLDNPKLDDLLFLCYSPFEFDEDLVMPTQVLAPGKTAADSGDIVIAAGATLTLGIYFGDDDNLILPSGAPHYEGDFLLPDGSSVLLLPIQATGELVPWGEEITLYRKDPNSAYSKTGIVFNGITPNHIIGPGTWRTNRDEATSASLGIQSD